MKRVFIDGSAGTTGLRIRERLANRKEIELVILPEEKRKDPLARRDALNGADIAFLCLPDAAATEAVTLVENPDTAIIDTSTAHRTAQGWVYGFAELPGQRARIAASKRIANPGCHASGFIALIAPLVHAGLLSSDALLCCTSLIALSRVTRSTFATGCPASTRSPLSTRNSSISTAVGISISTGSSAVSVPPPPKVFSTSPMVATAVRMVAFSPVSTLRASRGSSASTSANRAKPIQGRILRSLLFFFIFFPPQPP